VKKAAQRAAFWYHMIMLKFTIFLVAAVAFAYFAYVNFDETFGPEEGISSETR